MRVLVTLCFAALLCGCAHRTPGGGIVIVRDTVRTATHTQTLQIVRDSSVVTLRVDTLGRVDTLRVLRERIIERGSVATDTLVQRVTDTKAVEAAAAAVEAAEKDTSAATARAVKAETTARCIAAALVAAVCLCLWLIFYKK